MEKKMRSMEEIKKRYNGEWVLIADYETDDLSRIKRGRVLAHGKDQRQGLQTARKTSENQSGNALYWRYS